MPPDVSARPVMLSAADRRHLDRIAAHLENKNFKSDAEFVRGVAAKWDGGEHLVVTNRRHLAELEARASGRPFDPGTGEVR